MILGVTEESIGGEGAWVRLKVFLTRVDSETPHFCGELTLQREEWIYLQKRLQAWQIYPNTTADLTVALTRSRVTEDKPS